MFDQCFDIILKLEGGHTNNTRDPGGETKYGISKRAYPNVDIKSLTLQDAKDIYKRNYWDSCKCDQLPMPLSLFVFDAAINQGCDAAIRMLQKVLSLPQDGVIGPKTLEAANKSANEEVIALYMTERALRYTGTRNFDYFGRGWFKRLFLVTLKSE